MLLRALARASVAFLSPATCAACDAETSGAVIFCAACASTLERAPPATSSERGGAAMLIAPLLYGGAIATAITRFKYADRPDLARPLAEIVRGALASTSAIAPMTHDVVVPVPLHLRRLTERRYNQSALLAAPLARHLGARFAPRALERTRDTPAQASLDRAARVTNLEGAFVLRTPRVVLGARVLLVDDVRTTGATLDACAGALRAGGAREVEFAVIARVARGRAAGV